MHAHKRRDFPTARGVVRGGGGGGGCRWVGRRQTYWCWCRQAHRWLRGQGERGLTKSTETILSMSQVGCFKGVGGKRMMSGSSLPISGDDDAYTSPGSQNAREIDWARYMASPQFPEFWKMSMPCFLLPLFPLLRLCYSWCSFRQLKQDATSELEGPCLASGVQFMKFYLLLTFLLQVSIFS